MLVAIAIAWLFLFVLALAILRAAGTAERDAEARLRAPRYRRSSERSRRGVTTTVVAVALPLAGSAVLAADADAQGCHGARSAPAANGPSATLCLINRERRARGLVPLKANAKLERAAQRHAVDMVAHAFFSHVTPSGRTFSYRLRKVQYARGCPWAGGETLAWGTGSMVTPASRVRAWMHSPPHRAILLSRSYREGGVGIANGSPSDAASGATYVGEFGRRRC